MNSRMRQLLITVREYIAPQRRLVIEVEVLQGLHRREVRAGDPQAGAGGFPVGDLPLQDCGQVLLMRPPVLPGRGGRPPLPRFGHSLLAAWRCGRSWRGRPISSSRCSGTRTAEPSRAGVPDGQRQEYRSGPARPDHVADPQHCSQRRSGSRTAQETRRRTPGVAARNPWGISHEYA